MLKNRGKTETFIVVIIFLCGLAAFSLYKYTRINVDLGQKKQQITELEARNNAISQELEEQKARLAQATQEKKTLEEEVALGKQDLGQLKLELADSRKELANLQRTVEELTAGNQALQKEQAGLTAKIEELNTQKNALETKLSSVDELKQILKDLKKAKRTVRRNKAGKELNNKKTETADSNRGYIIYQGKPTFKSKVSIQVLPVQ